MTGDDGQTVVPAKIEDIRLAQPDEAAIVREVSASAYLPAYTVIPGKAPKPAFEDYAPRIADGNVWVLTRSDCICGVLVLERAETYYLIYSIAVLPADQGKGYGQLLLAWAEKLARQSQITALRLFTNAKMTANRRLYRRNGFVETGERPHPSRPGEVLVDMEKNLPPV